MGIVHILWSVITGFVVGLFARLAHEMRVARGERRE